MTVSFVIRVRKCLFKELKMRAKRAEDTIATRGFLNRKLASTVFRQHELSAFHKKLAVERVITLPAATTDIGVAISCLEFFSVTNDGGWVN